MKVIILIFWLAVLSNICLAQNINGFSLVEKKEAKQIDVLYNGKLLTAYCYYNSIKKPFLFPVNTLDGITVTRGYPVTPRAGERTDHPHHTGLWLNYESVNGLDFWNNSTAIPDDKRNNYGTIIHQKLISKQSLSNKAVLNVEATWLRPDSIALLKEKTSYTFTVKDSLFFIDRVTTLTAKDSIVLFKDVKDGFFAIRVARELEMPSQQEDVFVDNKGNKTTVAKINNEGVTGMYYSSNGLQGDSVWSSKGPWVMLKGVKDGRHITIAMIDHPANVGYPTYWHARGYGLFALNPLGREVFSKGKDVLNFSLKPGTSVTFRYRVVIASNKEIHFDEMKALANDFKEVF
jgi:hypothetical protein